MCRIVLIFVMLTLVGFPAHPSDLQESPRASKKGRFSSISWYLYGGSLENNGALAEETVPTSILLEELGELGELPFVSTDVETAAQLGLGGTYCVNDHFSLDFGMQYASEQIATTYGIPALSPRGDIFPSASGDVTFLHEVLVETEAQVFSVGLTGKFYPLGATCVRPWLSAGIRGVFLQPGDGTLSTTSFDGAGASMDFSDFEDVEMIDPSAGAGVDFRLGDRFDLSISGDYGLDLGWRAGIALIFKVGVNGCGRCSKGDHADKVPADKIPAIPAKEGEEGNKDDEDDDEEEERCGPFLPGEAPLPRILTPKMAVRLPAAVDSEALPAGAEAHFPAFDGDPFFVRFPAGSVARKRPKLFLAKVIPKTLRAIGLEAGMRALKESASSASPEGKFASLTVAVEHEFASDPAAFSLGDPAMIDVLRRRSAPDAAIDATLEDALGMSFDELVAEVERGETLVSFYQVVGATPIEHTLLLASHSPGRGMSVRGALINDYLLANEVALDSPIEAADQAMKELPGIQGVELPKEGEGPALVLLPYGTAGDGRVQLRYAYRMILTARFCQQEVPFLLWIDAEDASILKLEPLVTDLADGDVGDVAGRGVHDGGGEEREMVEAPASIYNRDPGVGKTTTLLRVYSGAEGRLSLEAEGLNRPDFQDDGFDEFDVAIPYGRAERPNFDQPPFNDAGQALCGSGSNKQFQQVHFFASLMRYRRYSQGLGIDPVFSLAWKPGVESPRAGCGAWSNMSFGACKGYYDAACPEYSDGTESLDNCLNFAHDNTVIAHEMGHNVTAELTNRRPFDWCGEEICPLPVGWRSLHDLADFWADHFESTNCVAGWACKNVRGVDASLACRSHSEGAGMPRLHELPLPLDPSAPGDHFPEHRRLASGEYADMQIAAAVLFKLQTGMRSKSRTAGSLLFAPRFARALYRTGFLGFTPPDSDLGIYQYLMNLETELVDEWASGDDPTTSKVTASFARAGLFVIPYQCLDGDPATADPRFCPSGEDGGDAVIDIDDNDSEDDYAIRGVHHPEVDYLELGGTPPTFHVWTGPLYRFESDGVAVLSKAAPCNRKYRVDVSTDPAFPPGVTFDSRWVEVDGGSQAASSAGCYGAWTPSAEQWDRLQAGGAGSRIYYRVTTRDAGGNNPRVSTEPGGGLWSVPAPYAVLTEDGTARY